MSNSETGFTPEEAKDTNKFTEEEFSLLEVKPEGSIEASKVQKFAKKIKYGLPFIPDFEEDEPDDIQQQKTAVLNYVSHSQDELNLTDHETKLVLAYKMIDFLRHGNLHDFLWLGSEFEIDSDSIPESILLDALEEGVAITVNFREDFSDYESMVKMFPNYQKTIRKGVIKGYEEAIQKGWYTKTKEIYKRFSKEFELDAPSQAEYLVGLKAAIRYGSGWEDISSLVLKTGTSEEEVTKMLYDRITEEHWDFDIDNFCRLLNFQTASIESLLRHPRLTDAYTRLKINPNFSSLPKFLQLRLTVLTVFKDNGETIVNEEVKYIVQAYEINPAMAGYILKGIISGDEYSKDNIHRILECQPKEAQNSKASYRRMVQDSLLSYKRNREILASLESKGVDIDHWLNYDRERSFILENSEDKLSLIIETPCERLLESIKNIKAHTLETLNDYQPELKNQLSENPEIVKMRDQLERIDRKIHEAAGNNSLAEKLIKVKESIEQKIQAAKSIPAWTKIIGDIAAVEKPLKDLQEILSQAKSQETYQKADSELQKYIEKNILKIGEKLQAWFILIEQVTGVILGKERAVAISQEIKEGIVKDLDHWHRDLKDIETQVEKRKGKTESLVGRPVTISLWRRDATNDLYLGHYTYCCIRADSTILEGELTITDYLTDLGMQVIVVTDEKTKKPFAAAWCFVGLGNEDQSKFVIDNIEADTAYSGPFKKILTQELANYIKEYATASGLTDVEQGPHNNDLKVAKYGKSTSKIGGYNRPEGYYLEGEQDDEEE